MRTLTAGMRTIIYKTSHGVNLIFYYNYFESENVIVCIYFSLQFAIEYISLQTWPILRKALITLLCILKYSHVCTTGKDSFSENVSWLY